MKLLFVLSALFLGALSQNIVWRGNYNTLPELPGLDFIGFGYDARFADLQDALQLPLMDFSYTKQKAYFYPANRTTVFKVPDEVIVRTIAYTEATAVLFNSVEEVIEKMTSDSGIDFQQEVTLENSTAICVNTTDAATNQTTQNCTTTSSFSNTQLFSIGAQINYVKESFGRTEQYRVENSESTQLYGVVLDTRFMRSDLKNAMLELNQNAFSSNPKIYYKFLETYGTHYVVSAVMGGKVAMETNIDKSTSSLTDDDTESRTTVTNQQALAGATATFQSSVSGTSDFSLSNSQQKTQFSQTSNWKLAGGDSNLVNLLDTRESADAVKIWKPSIIYNPVPVQYRLRSMATLFEDTFVRQQVKNAIAVYLTFSTEDIQRIGFDITTGTWRQVTAGN